MCQFTQVRKLAKSSDPAIAKAAEEVVQSWKEAVTREQGVEARRSSGSGATTRQPSSDNPESAFLSRESLNTGVCVAGGNSAGAPFSPAVPQPSVRAAQAAIPGRREFGAQAGPSQSPAQSTAAATEGAARSGSGAAPRPAAYAAGMAPPKTGVGARDKMRQLLADALTMALPDVRGGEPGTALYTSTW